MSSSQRRGICTPTYYANNIPGFTQAHRGKPYYIITGGPYAGIYRYWRLANERATHSSQTARGVESIEAACDVWAWTCREYHTHDNRDELVLYSDSVCEPRETRETREVVEQPIISHDDQRNRPQINIAQLNIESRPNPVIDSPPSPSKKTSTKVPSPKTFFNPPIVLQTSKTSKSRSQSPSKKPSTSKSPSSNQLKGIDIDAISSLLSDQSISTPIRTCKPVAKFIDEWRCLCRQMGGFIRNTFYSRKREASFRSSAEFG
ncbi:hypothetical protein F5880DRAFT_1619229 [Lentinula raphanica]|nr:hypothetical protein F5880DRAFT_1619229 [Lentinula raphanica]